MRATIKAACTLSTNMKTRSRFAGLIQVWEKDSTRHITRGRSLFEQIGFDPKLSEVGRLRLASSFIEVLPEAAKISVNIINRAYKECEEFPGLDPWLANVLAFKTLDRFYDQDLAASMRDSILKNLTRGSYSMLEFLSLALERGYEISPVHCEIMFNSIQERLRDSSFSVSAPGALHILCTFGRLVHLRGRSKLAELIIVRNVIPYLNSLMGSNALTSISTALQVVHPFVTEDWDKMLAERKAQCQEGWNKLALDVLGKIYCQHGSGQQRQAWKEPLAFDRADVGDLLASTARVQDIAEMIAVCKHIRKYVKALELKSKTQADLVRPEQLLQAVDILNAPIAAKNRMAKLDAIRCVKSVVRIAEHRSTVFTVDDLIKLSEAVKQIDVLGKSALRLDNTIRDYIRNMSTVYLPHVLSNLDKKF